MRIISATIFLVLFYLTGCSQNEKHNVQNQRKIPIDPKRWYVLNNTGANIAQLFDSQLYARPTSGNGRIIENYEAWYPLLNGEQMTIDSIEMYDWEGTNEQRPSKIYAILDDWQRVTIGNFMGLKYNKWVGPDPQNPDNFALKEPISNIRYLVINTWGDLPTEIEFFGTYTPPHFNKPEIKHAPLNNFFGVNGFEWDFENPKNSITLDPLRLNAIKSFTGLRHYLDLEKIEPKEGSFTFNPAKNGGWNYDTMYYWCKANNIEVLACLKNNPPWMLETYPENQKDNENIPIRFAKDPTDPVSYIEQAKAAFQFAARYGHNKNIIDAKSQNQSLVTVDAAPRWYNDVVNKVKTGLGLINYIECSNETDKWWKGRKAYQTGREYAANLSAFYDGNKNTMGAGVGVKNADSTMKVVMAGVANPSTDYLLGMIDWCKEFRGLKPDGTPDLPWDIINYHYYSCEFAKNTKPTLASSGEAGVAPELSNTETIALNFINVAQQYAQNMPVWVTEAGYDINQGSPQKAIPIGKKTPLETQADWILRTALLYSRLGISKVFFYEITDDNGSSIKYGTAGLINNNKTRRPAADYLYQTNKYFGKFTYVSTLSSKPCVDKYIYNDNPMYVLYSPTQTGKTISYTLEMKGAEFAFVYTPKAGSENMELQKVKTKNGKVELTVSETPVFITSTEVGK